METNGLEERRRFVRALATGQWSMALLCARFGITPPCGYKWWRRYQAGGEAALVEQSRAPQHRPHRLAAPVRELLLAERRQYGWGARKVRVVLQARHPTLVWPAISTINALFDAAGLLTKQRQRRRHHGTPAPAPMGPAPYELWSLDYKGQFRLGNGAYCYPLTIVDHHSRLILGIHGSPRISAAQARRVCERLFREVGVPAAVRTDNGSPFVSHGLRGLSALNVWWMQLGITHQRTRPGRPQDNGRHERMHRELKRETARPPATTAYAQQQRFDHFRKRFNEVRPHEGLAMATPVSCWTPPRRPYPTRLAPPDYPAHWEVRRVSTEGTVKLRNRCLFLSKALRGHDVGFEEVDNGCWRAVYYQLPLVTINLATGKWLDEDEDPV